MAKVKELDFILLFQQFIKETRSGKRLQPNGSRVKENSIKMYDIVLVNISRFISERNFYLRIRLVTKLSARDLKTERNYWKKFYKQFTDFLFAKGLFDNYVGRLIKVIRTFFNYLNKEKGILTGDFYKNFYAKTETIPIIVLSPEQLKFLINNSEFEKSLSPWLRKVKDIFVFGCSVGLRVSDLMELTNKNIEVINNSWYLNVRSQKTKTDTRIKLPDYTIAIIKKWNKKQKTLLPQLSKGRLNITVKKLCEKAGWTYDIGKTRERRGLVKKVTRNGKHYRFCDLVTTHTMRRTAITTLLSLGVPETMVRKISGHAPGSIEFYRYVQFAQHYLDQQTDRAFSMLTETEHKPALESKIVSF